MTPTQKKHIRESITVYCSAAVGNENRIHYSQRRPFALVDTIGTGWHTLDCSGFVVNCFWNASHDLSLWIRDPSGMKFSGWGSTFSMEPWLREHGKRVTETNGFLVADIAMFDGHTMICSSKGTAVTSGWTSHGTEGGPQYRSLHYRDDGRGVFRHPALV